MKIEEYERMWRIENLHWWYVGMQRIADVFLSELLSDLKQWMILDAGCGTGGMLVYLKRYGEPIGIDLATAAVSFCQKRGCRKVIRGTVLELPLPAATFDLVTSFDVLCVSGVKDDLAGLVELNRVLKPEGWLLIRLPAYSWLRGSHDQTVDIARRYTATELKSKLYRVGFDTRRISYANTVLFPIALLKRLAETLGRFQSWEDLALPPTSINRAMASVLSLEARLIQSRSLPWGLSVICLAQKK